MRAAALLSASAALVTLACADAECTRNTDCEARARCELNRCVSDCRDDRDCTGGAVCSVNGECVAPARQDVPASEVGDVAAKDVAPDLPADRIDDRAVDASKNTPLDAAPEVSLDAAPEVSLDAAPEVSLDASPDDGPNRTEAAAPEVGLDAPGVEVGLDAPPDLAAPDRLDVRDVVDEQDVRDGAADADAPDVPVGPDAAACTPVPWRALTVGGAGDWGGSTAIAVDGAGRPAIVFHRATYGSYDARQLLFASLRPDGSWALEQIAMGTYNDRHDTTDLAFDAMGAPHVVYPGQVTMPTRVNVVTHATRVGARWVLSPLRGGVTWATANFDGEGFFHVVSGATQLDYARRSPAMGWSYGNGPPMRCVSSAVTPAGEVHAAYITPPTSATAPNDLIHAVLSPTGLWRTSLVESVGARYDSECRVAIGVSPRGEPHIAFRSGTGLRHASRAADGSWRSRVLTTTGGAPALTVDARGGVHVVYSDPLHYGYLPPGGVWQTGMVDARPGGIPSSDMSIAVDAAGMVHISTYQADRGSPYSVFYVTGRRCAP